MPVRLESRMTEIGTSNALALRWAAVGEGTGCAACGRRHGGWTETHMSDDLLTVRVLAAFGSRADRELMRQAAAMALVPIEVVEAEGVALACTALAGHEIDVVFLDAAAAHADLSQFIKSMRASQPATFVILVAGK